MAEATRRIETFVSTWGGAYPSAVACVTGDVELLVAHPHYPRAHWGRIRHTNLIERTFGETRRRVKVFGRLPGERSALSLLWAVLDRAASGWRDITYTPADVRLLQLIRRDLGLTQRQKDRPEPDPTGDVTAAASSSPQQPRPMPLLHHPRDATAPRHRRPRTPLGAFPGSLTTLPS